MEKRGQPKSLEELVEERAETARKITLADAGGEKEKLDDLHKRHEELTAMIEDMPNEDELRHAA